MWLGSQEELMKNACDFYLRASVLYFFNQFYVFLNVVVLFLNSGIFLNTPSNE